MSKQKAFWAGVLVAACLGFAGNGVLSQMHKYSDYRVCTLDNGVIMESFRPEPSEIVEALQMKRWHFRATLPPGSDADCFLYGVEVRKKGVPSPKSGGLSYVPNGRTMEISVCLTPETGGWANAENFSIWMSDNFPQHTDGPINSRANYPNPFRGAVYRDTQTCLDIHPQKDGSLLLISAKKDRYKPVESVVYDGVLYTDGTTVDDVSVVLKMEAVNQLKRFPGLKEPMPPNKSTRPFWEAWLL